MVETRRSLYATPLPDDPATPITNARAPQPLPEGVAVQLVTVPSQPNASSRECVRAIQSGLGAKDYQLSGTGSAEEKRKEFHRFNSTLDLVLRETHSHYRTLLDIRNELPDGFECEQDVNNHLFTECPVSTHDWTRPIGDRSPWTC